MIENPKYESNKALMRRLRDKLNGGKAGAAPVDKLEIALSLACQDANIMALSDEAWETLCKSMVKYFKIGCPYGVCCPLDCERGCTILGKTGVSRIIAEGDGK